MGWGWRSKYRTSSYSSNLEVVVFFFFLFFFLLFFLQMHFSCIAMRDTGELHVRCPATALIDGKYSCNVLLCRRANAQHLSMMACNNNVIQIKPDHNKAYKIMQVARDDSD